MTLFQAEELGCEGKVEEAQGIMKLCDQLNEERTQLQNVRILLFYSKVPLKRPFTLKYAFWY